MHAIIDAHVMIGALDQFGERVSLPPTEAALLGDSIQDPHGTLYVALQILENSTIIDMDKARITGGLPFRTRVQLASILAFAHKLCTSSNRSGINTEIIALQALVSPFELPGDTIAWDRLLQIVASNEVHCASQGFGHSIQINNPIHWMDQRLDQLQREHHISATVATILRGAAFFFLGSCFVNPETNILPPLKKSVGVQAVGEGLLMVLVLCYGLSQPKPRWFRLGVSTEARRAAVLLVKNAACRHSNKLRCNVFADTNTIVGKLVSRHVLQNAETYVTKTHT